MNRSWMMTAGSLGLVILVGCAKEHTPQSPGGLPASDRLELQDCLAGAKQLDNSVDVVCRQEGRGSYVATLQHDEATIDIRLMRGASFLGLADAPGIVVIHHCTYSNEDEILLVDLTANPTEIRRIAHPDGIDYIHVHYRLTPGKAGVINVTESHYAAADPVADAPRTRSGILSLTDAAYEPVFSPWQVDRH